MYAHFRYLDGPRQGDTKVIGHDFATIGRHPSSDLPFDATDELQVSVRHAAVFKQGGGFLIRDLGSTNGTYLNGKRVRGDRSLETADIIQFGPSGPKLEFTIAATVPVSANARPPVVAPVAQASEIIRPAGRTTERIRVEVSRQTRAWKWVAIGAVAVATGAGGLMAWHSHQLRQALERDRATLLGQVDAVISRLARAQAPIAGLRTALADARRGIDSLKTRITSGQVSAARLDTLAKTLGAETGRHEALLDAAALDPVAAAQASSRAVAVIVAEFGDGRVASGTGFGVRRRGDTVWVATARHLVQDSLGTPAVRFAVIFNGSGQAFRARIGRVHDSADAALLILWIRGGAPVVAGLSDSVRVGDPVAITGFPFGLDSLGDWRTNGTAATSATGTVTEQSAELLGVDGYGTHGSSGSPIFAKNGAVVGLVSGGGRVASQRLVAVPGRYLREMISALGARPSALGAGGGLLVRE